MATFCFYGGHAVLRDLIAQVREQDALNRIVVIHQEARWDLHQVADVSFYLDRSLAQAYTDERTRTVKNLDFWRHVRSTLGGAFFLHVGADNAWFQQHQNEFKHMGIRCLTGVSSAASFAELEVIDDKVAFSERVSALGLPAIPSIQVKTLADLQQARKHIESTGALTCVKPVHGIYGAEFWCLDPQASPYACFADPDSRRVNPALYESTVGHWLSPMVAMPYLSGVEYSADILAYEGELVVAAVREKTAGGQQVFSEDQEVVELCLPLIKTFKLHGLVNAQFKRDAQGKLFVLEINPRPSGGSAQLANIGIPLAHWWAGLMIGQLSAADIKAKMAQIRLPQRIKSHSGVIIDRDFK